MGANLYHLPSLEGAAKFLLEPQFDYAYEVAKTPIDKHLARLPKAQANTLLELRDQLVTLLPTATETISYNLATIKIHGVGLISFDGFKQHNSIFPSSGSITQALAKDLAKYDFSKGAIKFPLDQKIPTALVKKIIKHRIAEINSSYPKKSGEYLEFYGNGVLKAEGKYKSNQLHGKWQWYRKDGTKMRSGEFKLGKQVGTWITYDQSGKPHKTTNFN
jgi:uncharacterized protein YdhG (YjbR/CyaY superfamily)